MDGQPMDVFIPIRGRKATNSRFGFVRYNSLGEAKAAIRRWNRANVEANLVVMLADTGGKPRDGGRVVRRRQELPVGDRGKEGLTAVWKPKLRDAAQSPEARQEEYEEWAHTSLVADLKIIKLGETLEKELRSEGVAFVKVIHVDGRKVLIQFFSGEDLERCLYEDYRSVLRNFTKLQRWSEEAMPKTRTVWISVLGLPFRAWTEVNGERLAAPYRVFLKMDDRDVHFVGKSPGSRTTSGYERSAVWGCGIDNPESLIGSPDVEGSLEASFRPYSGRSSGKEPVGTCSGVRLVGMSSSNDTGGKGAGSDAPHAPLFLVKSRVRGQRGLGSERNFKF
ncbi:hypothetical protein QQ045_027983 [Rhodiola kirilowii]